MRRPTVPILHFYRSHWGSNQKPAEAEAEICSLYFQEEQRKTHVLFLCPIPILILELLQILIPTFGKKTSKHPRTKPKPKGWLYVFVLSPPCQNPVLAQSSLRLCSLRRKASKQMFTKQIEMPTWSLFAYQLIYSQG